jgi:predicted metal-binding membrane protein
MKQVTPLEAVLRKDRLVITTSLIVVAVLGWAYMVYLAQNHACNGHGQHGYGPSHVLDPCGLRYDLHHVGCYDGSNDGTGGSANGADICKC